MRHALRKLLKRNPVYTKVEKRVPSLVITRSCVDGMVTCLRPEQRIGHEGICYLLGSITETTTLAVSAIRPEATTTRGSFNVNEIAMARVVRKAADLGLSVVGQTHTHPGEAYHSGGDVEGAKIAYSGFCSLVFPDFGQLLPSFTGAAVYIFQAPYGFREIQPDSIHIVEGVANGP